MGEVAMSISTRCKSVLALALFLGVLPLSLAAQDKDAKPADKPADAATPPAPKEESSVTDHSIRIGSQTIPYKAVT
jgi:hypothetical protein